MAAITRRVSSGPRLRDGDARGGGRRASVRARDVPERRGLAFGRNDERTRLERRRDSSRIRGRGVSVGERGADRAVLLVVRCDRYGRDPARARGRVERARRTVRVCAQGRRLGGCEADLQRMEEGKGELEQEGGDAEPGAGAKPHRALQRTGGTNACVRLEPSHWRVTIGMGAGSCNSLRAPSTGGNAGRHRSVTRPGSGGASPRWKRERKRQGSVSASITCVGAPSIHSGRAAGGGALSASSHRASPPPRAARAPRRGRAPRRAPGAAGPRRAAACALPRCGS